MRTFVFSGSIQAEDVEHAMASIALDLLTSLAESAAESGQLGQVVTIDIHPSDD